MIHADLHEVAVLLSSGGLAAESGTEAPLDEALYAWYLNRSGPTTQGGLVLAYELSLPDALRAAHAGSIQFVGGSKAESVSTWGRVVTTSGPLQRMLERSEYVVPSRPGLRAEPGDSIAVSQCWDWVDEDRGFWYTRRGDWPPPQADRLVRVYWNCAPSVAPTIVGQLTAVLAANPEHSYTIKTIVSQQHGGRADALVLYLAPDGYAALEGFIVDTAAGLADQMRNSTPKCAAVLSSGLAVAEGPIGGESFGQSRAALIAAAHNDADSGCDSRLEAIVAGLEDVFEMAGLDAQRPYLEPDPERDYV
ncbi:MAG: T3SS effector HopA1 family protein [Actinomycetia bacterium]|nr:T3SS effector HopA1 family protein [Actinomycetes bacterium]